MSIALVARPPIEGFEVRRPPVGGAVWDRGVLARLDGERLAWTRALAEEPRLAVAGRRLYVGFEEVVACLDLRTGAEVWVQSVGASIAALAAHADGVEVLAGTTITQLGGHGDLVWTREVPGAEHLAVTMTERYVGGPGGLWRVPASGACVRLASQACVGLWTRDEHVGAFVVDGEGTTLIEAGGVHLVWSFPDYRSHLFASYGRAEWAVAPTTGPAGVWVVDRRVQPRWRVGLPGAVRSLAVVGAAVAALLDDHGAVLALTHPDVSDPLLLEASGAQALSAADDILFVAEPGRTRLYRLR
jgi:hypothetical protein